MIQGLYLSAQGAQLQSLRQDTISNNLANTGTNGFKRDLVRAQALHLPQTREGAVPTALMHLQHLPGGVAVYDVVTDYSNGPIVPSDSDTDLALAGSGFLQISDGERNYLTRNGNLRVSSTGRLETDSGDVVLGPNGRPITGIDPTQSLEISSDGMLSQQGNPLGQVGLFEPDDVRSLTKIGDSRFVSPTPVKPTTTTRVMQGYLETSGTKPTNEMIDLITASRGMEANLNMIKHQDESLGRLLELLPRR